MAFDSANKLSEVVSNLYLGNLDATKDVEALKQRGVTHILTVNNVPLKKAVSSQFVYKFVPGLDLEFTDLLSQFEESVQFIKDGIEHGGVLVHCLMGCSRSATMVIAYIMKNQNLGFEEAFKLVRQRRPIAHPNEGFISQLMLYEEMGYKIDSRNENYRMYRLKKLATRMQCPSEEGGLLPGDLTENPTDSEASDDCLYKCKKCRQALFRKSGCISHTVGEGEAAFDWRGKMSTSPIARSEDICEKSLFIEPVKWMAEFIQVQEGKILCPKCSAKLGSFIWYGERCPCGAWVAPAFHVQTSKVDECKPHMIPVPRHVPH